MAALTAPVAAQGPGRVAGRYRIEAELGRGGMGAVYRAFDEGTGQTLALKLLERGGERLIALFEREYETLAKLDHPRVIAAYDYGVAENGQRYYTMELLGGTDVAALAPMPWTKVCTYLRDVCISLSLLHAQRLVHRDVNPRNVRLDGHGRAKLIDFGALSPFGIASEIVGTPSCMAPEALWGRALDARADLFSLGVVMYYALTGQRPYGSSDLANLEAAFRVPPLDPSQHVADIPRALCELTLSLISIDPLGRPDSAADVIDRLSALMPADDERAASDARVASWVLVGRGPEQAALEQIVDRTLRGRGGVVSVDGAQGLGRSRLIKELCIDARLRGLRTLVIRGADCSEQAGLLAALARGLLTVAPDAAREALPGAALSQLLSSVDPGLVAATAAPPEEEGRDPFERMLEQHEAMAAWVGAVARRHPLLLAIDDAHLLHPRDAFVLVLLGQQTPCRPLSLCLTRLSGQSCAPAVEQLALLGVSLSLQALSPAAVELLLRSAFGDVPNRTRLAQWLTSAGRGNPGHVMQLLRGLVARGAVREVGGTWALPADLNEVGAAEDPREADALPELSPEGRSLAQALAVYGRGLPEAVLARLSPATTPQSTREALRELVFRRVATETNEGHRIVHSAAQQALLAQLDDVQREAVHGALAGALCAADPLAFEAIENNQMEQVTTQQLVQSISVGLHRVRGRAYERGSKLLRRAAVELTVRGEGLAEAALDLEAAVETHRALGVPWHEYMALLPPLALAAPTSTIA
jgi:hypothetical protein